jgi:hypothetical protein
MLIVVYGVGLYSPPILVKIPSSMLNRIDVAGTYDPIWAIIAHRASILTQDDLPPMLGPTSHIRMG